MLTHTRMTEARACIPAADTSTPVSRAQRCTVRLTTTGNIAADSSIASVWIWQQYTATRSNADILQQHLPYAHGITTESAILITISLQITRGHSSEHVPLTCYMSQLWQASILTLTPDPNPNLPKFNELFSGIYFAYFPNFMKIYPYFLFIRWQTDKQTNGGKNSTSRHQWWR